MVVSSLAAVLDAEEFEDKGRGAGDEATDVYKRVLLVDDVMVEVSMDDVRDEDVGEY